MTSVEEVAHDYLVRNGFNETETARGTKIGLDRYIARDSLTLNFHENFQNGISYAIIIEQGKTICEVMDEEGGIQRLPNVEELKRELFIREVSPGVDIERAGKAIEGLNKINRGVLFPQTIGEREFGCPKEYLDYATLVQEVGQELLGTPAHLLGYTLVSHSMHLPHNLFSGEAFIDFYLRTVDSAVASEISRN